MSEVLHVINQIEFLYTWLCNKHLNKFIYEHKTREPNEMYRVALDFRSSFISILYIVSMMPFIMYRFLAPELKAKLC